MKYGPCPGALSVVVMLAAAGLGVSGPESATPAPPIPYVATRHDTVRGMLWLADVGADDVVYDLGSGDGRVVIAAARDFAARRAVGIEIDRERVRESRERVRKSGVEERVEIVAGDMFDADLRDASVVTLYVGHRANIKLRSRLFRMLEPGARVVSHGFGMGEWMPDKSLTVRTVYFGMWGEAWNPWRENERVPSYDGNEPRYGDGDKAMLWVIPAPVAGTWRAGINLKGRKHDCCLTLHQRLSEATGTLAVSGSTNFETRVFSDLWGDHLRLYAMRSRKYGYDEIRLDVRVCGNRMKGTLQTTEGRDSQQQQWRAQREESDIEGVWEWPCATGERQVRLAVKDRGGGPVATYRDRGRAIPITDFYDFGGGFYFTLLVGRGESGGLEISKDTGWLIGEAVVQDGTARGSLEFHPYGDSPFSLDGRKEPEPVVIRDWCPQAAPVVE